MADSVGIVVPAYRPAVDRLQEFVRALDGHVAPAELRVELDAPDPDVVERLSDLPATVSVSEERRGKGRAITSGFEALTTDVLAFTDADGSTPPPSVAAVVAAVRDGDADIAVGSRRHPQSRVESHQTLVRRRLGDGFAWLARRVVSPALYDYQCGAKAVSREAWTATREHLYRSGFGWDIELVATADAMEYAVREVPVTWQDRERSTVSPVRTPVRLAAALVAARRQSSRLRRGLPARPEGNGRPLVEQGTTRPE